MQVYYNIISNKYEKITINSVQEEANAIKLKAILKDIRPNCVKCNSDIIHINQTKTRTIKDTPYNDKEVVINLTYRRYKCYKCKYKFTQTQNIVKTNHKYSRDAINYCIKQFYKMRSGKDIATDTYMSTTTVWRYFNKIEIEEELTGVTGLYIDEFKGNAGEDKYQLSILNQDKKLLATLTSRRSKIMQKFFDRLDKTKIKFVVVDLFKPFRSLLKKNFPNASIVADPYHYFRQVNWCLRDRRIALYNSEKEEFKDYKKYWKLFVKNPLNLTNKQKQRLEQLLTHDTKLKLLHNAYKNFYELHNLRFDLLEQEYNKLLVQILAISCEESKKLHSTLKSWKFEIFNAIVSKKSNGVLEGFNNKTKVIKRISYGFKKHTTFNKMMHLRLNSSASIKYSI